MLKLIEYIKGINGIGWASFLALIVTIGHSAFVYEAVSQYGKVISPVLAVIFALAFDIAVLIFVLRGRKWLSRGFSILQIGMNLLYYYPRLESGFEWFSALFISVSLPIALSAFSHEIAEDKINKEKQDKKDALDVSLETLKEEFLQYKVLMDKNFNETLEQLGSKLSSYHSVHSKKYDQVSEETDSYSEKLNELEQKINDLKLTNNALYETISNMSKIEPANENVHIILSKALDPLKHDMNNIKAVNQGLKELFNDHKVKLESLKESIEADILEGITDDIVTVKEEIKELTINVNNNTTFLRKVVNSINLVVKDIIDRKNNPNQSSSITAENYINILK